MAAHKAVDPKAAEAEAEQYWIGPAKKIVEPTRADIINSARHVPGHQGPHDPGEGPGDHELALHGRRRRRAA